MRYQPRVQQTPQEAPAAAPPMPPASHQRKKSHCSLKSRQWQNRTRRDLADHGKGGDQAGERRGDPSGALRQRQPRAPRTGQRCRRGRHSTRLLLQLQGLPSQLLCLCSWDKPLPRHRHTGQTGAPVRPAPSQDRPAAKRRLAPVQPCWGTDFTGSQTRLPTRFAKSGSACGQKLHASCLLPGLFL